MKKKIIFVLGTGTDVGKTYFSSQLIEQFFKKSPLGRALYLKPIESGKPSDTEIIQKQFKNQKSQLMITSFYQFPEPVSPHLAAKLNKVMIKPNQLVTAITKYLALDDDFIVIEGAGGVFTPLTETKTYLDVIKALGLPVTLVAPAGLGAINQVLSTVYILKQQQIKVNEIILNRFKIKSHQINNLILKSNKAFIEKKLKIPCQWI